MTRDELHKNLKQEFFDYVANEESVGRNFDSEDYFDIAWDIITDSLEELKNCVRFGTFGGNNEKTT